MRLIVLPGGAERTADRPTSKQLKRFRRLCRDGEWGVPTATAHTLLVRVEGNALAASLVAPDRRPIALVYVAPDQPAAERICRGLGLTVPGPLPWAALVFAKPTAWERRWVPEVAVRLAWAWVLHPARAAAA